MLPDNESQAVGIHVIGIHATGIQGKVNSGLSLAKIPNNI